MKETTATEMEVMMISGISSVKSVLSEAREHALYQACFFVVVTVFSFLLLERFVTPERTVFAPAVLVKNLLIIAAFNLALTGIFHAVRTALMISEVFFLVVGVANYFIIAFRGYGIVFMDFFAVSTAAKVAGGYSYRVSAFFLVTVFLFLLMIVLTYFLLPPRKHRYKDWKMMTISLSGIAVSALFFLWINLSSVFFQDVTSLRWDHSIGMKENGYLLYFLANAGDMSIEEPIGYSAEKVDQILSAYSGDRQKKEQAEERSQENLKKEQEKEKSTENGTAPTKNHPNLIMIMNESFSDLRTLGNLTTDRPVLSFYDSLSENTIKGTAYSSVYGGYTANSEFEFLTGCSKLFFPGSPYLQYITEETPSIISDLKKQGYTEPVAIHPYHASGYNRSRVYSLLGFHEFLSLPDFDGKNLVRDYIGDLEDYQKIEELYEKKKKGTSLCVFNVTMQNHNAYNDKDYVFAEPVRVTSFHADSATNQYLSLMRMSDQALEQLVGYFEKEEEPTIIILFGDHQPHLADSLYRQTMGRTPANFSPEQVMTEHEIPFLIWANYDIEEKAIEKTSINYLSTLFLETAGLKLSDFGCYLKELQKKLPVISASGCYDSTGTLYHYEDGELDADQDEIEKALEEYEMINYSYLFEKEDGLKKYF